MASNKAGNDDEGGGSEEEGSSSASPGAAADDKEEGGGSGGIGGGGVGGGGGGGGRITRQSSLRNGTTTTNNNNNNNADTNTAKEKNNNGVGSAAGVGAAAAVKKKRTNSTSSDGGGAGGGGGSGGYSVATSRSRRLPCRPGIVWGIGERLEAMDFIHKWYPAKIVSIHEEKFLVLIHFEGWNSRYDEWVDMKCERLRPATRRSERKEKRKQMPCYKAGEHVLAKWSDSKMYPAKILDVKLPAGYEVLFYDGFTRMVQPSHIQTLPADAKRMDPIPIAAATTTTTTRSAGKVCPSTDSKDDQAKDNPSDGNATLPGYSVKKERGERRERKEVKVEVEAELEVKERTKKKEKEEEKEVTEEKKEKEKESEKKEECGRKSSGQPTDQVLPVANGPTLTDTKTTVTTTTTTTTTTPSTDMKASVGVAVSTGPGKKEKGALPSKSGPAPPAETLADTPGGGRGGGAEQKKKGGQQPPPLAPSTKSKGSAPPTPHPRTEPQVNSETSKVKELAEELAKPVVLPANLTEDKKKEVPTTEETVAPKAKEKKANLFPTRRRQKLIVAGAFLAKRDASRKSPLSPAKKTTAAAAATAATTSAKSKAAALRMDTTEKADDKGVDKRTTSTASSSSSSSTDRRTGFRDARLLEEPRATTDKRPERRLAGERRSWHSSSSTTSPASGATAAPGGGGSTTAATHSGRFQKQAAQHANSGGGGGGGVDGKGPLLKMVDRPVAEMKELEKALTIGFLPNTRPGMAPLSSAVTPSTAYLNMMTATTSMYGDPVVSPAPAAKSALGRKVRTRPGAHRPGRKRGLSKPPDPTDLSAKKELPVLPGEQGLARKRMKLTGKVASQEFTIQDDHNPYKCMFANCNKSFRKDHRLQYHIKYYHMEENGKAMLQSPATVAAPTTKRHKTSPLAGRDMVSTPVTVKEKKHGRRRSKNIERPAASSSSSTAAAAAATTAAATAAAAAAMESVVEEFVEFEMEDTSSEVIHCVCNQVEEKGLMIQCEVCMCWQHASCMNLDEATLPKKYICSICQNPRGVRPSSKYIYDQDWLKLGQLPGFSFVESRTDHSDTVETILATNTLVGDLHNIIAVLYGIKRQIKLSLSNDKSGLKLWTKNWSVLASQQQQQQEQQQQQQLINKSIAESLLLRREPSFRDPVLIDPQLPAEILDDQQDSDTDEGEPVQQQQGNDKDSQHASLDSNNNNNNNSSRSLSDQKLSGLDSSTGPAGLPSSSSSSSMSAKSPHLTNGGKIPGQLGNSVNDPDPASKKSGDMKRGPFVVDNCGSVDGEPKLAGNNNNNSCKPSITDGDGGVKVANSENPPDPLQQYQTNLLQYVMQTQKELDHRLDSIGEQIERLEDKEKISTPLSSDLPLLRKSLRSMMNDLGKVRKMAAYQ